MKDIYFFSEIFSENKIYNIFKLFNIIQNLLKKDK